MECGPELDRLVHRSAMGECACTFKPVDDLDEADLDDGQRESVVGAGLWVFRCPDCGKQRLAERDEPPFSLDIPRYSTDIAAAWRVLEKCYEGGEIITISRDLDDQFIAGICHWTGNRQREDGSWVKIWDDTKFEPQYKCPTAPHAICIAAVAFYLEDEGERWEWEEPLLTKLRERHPELEADRPKRSGPDGD